MGFLRLAFSYSFLLLHLSSLTICQPDFRSRWCYNNSGNYAENSNYKRNLDSLLSSLASDTEVDYGFYNLSVGQAPDQVNAIALCRGDIGVDDCRACISNSTRKILEICPNQKEAFGVYDLCMLKYSDRLLTGVLETSPSFISYTSNNASDVKKHTHALQTLLHRLRGLTASGNSIRKFATGRETAGFERVYALMQCTPDLSGYDCDNCLSQAIRIIAKFAKKSSCSVIAPSCDVRFDNKLFYQLALPDTPPSQPVYPPPPPPPPRKGKKSNKAQTVIVIIVPIVSFVMLVLCICIFLKLRRPWQRAESEKSTENSLQLDFETVRDATNNFSDKNKLGQGGFGAVYKGTLPNGQDIAAKRLSKDSGQGDMEFENEVLLHAKLEHRNLVRLLGFCLDGNERILVYEFVPNGSLGHFIFGL